MSIRLLSAVVVLVLAGVGWSLHGYLEAERATWRAQHTAAQAAMPEGTVATCDAAPTEGSSRLTGASTTGNGTGIGTGDACAPGAAAPSAPSEAPIEDGPATASATPVRPCSLQRIDLDLELLDASPSGRP